MLSLRNAVVAALFICAVPSSLVWAAFNGVELTGGIEAEDVDSITLEFDSGSTVDVVEADAVPPAAIEPPPPPATAVPSTAPATTVAPSAQPAAPPAPSMQTGSPPASVTQQPQQQRRFGFYADLSPAQSATGATGSAIITTKDGRRIRAPFTLNNGAITVNTALGVPLPSSSPGPVGVYSPRAVPTPAVATTPAYDVPASIGYIPRFSVSLSGVPSRIDANSRFGGGVRVVGDREVFASHTPESIWRDGIGLSFSFDLGNPVLFGVPEYVSRVLPGGTPSTRFYTSFGYAKGDDEDTFSESEAGVQYGIIFAEETTSTGYGLYDGSAGFGLESTTKVDSPWFRGDFGLETKIPHAFNNDRLTAKGSVGLFYESLKADYWSETVVTLNGVEAPIYGYQRTDADTDDQYFGVKLGGQLQYALTDRLSLGIGADLYPGYRWSSADVSQHNQSGAAPPLDDFRLDYSYDDDGFEFGLGASLSAEYALTDRFRLGFKYERISLPGVTSILMPQNPDEQPLRFDSEKICRDFFEFRLTYDF